MNDTKVFELHVWKGDWGLPSIDTNCLQVLAYAKFNNIPLKLNALCNPYRTPHGKLPVLRSGEIILDSPEDIIKFFRKNNYNCDHILSQKECAIVKAYDVMLREKLYPALKFIWWLDEKNANELIKPWYFKALPFPFNFYYPGKIEREAQDLFEVLYSPEDNLTIIETKVYSEAQKCLTLLSTRLGDAEYFFSHQPTIIDAIIYSYLAPLLKAPLGNPALQNHLKACTNLEKYVIRISQKYFATEYQDYERHMAEESARKLKKDSETEFPNKRRNQLLAGFIASLAMTGYALSTGMVEVPVKDNEMLDEYAENILDDEEHE